MSLARQHFQKHSAKAAAETAAAYGSMQNLNAYELQLAQLNNDRARLKQIQSTEGKIKLKQALLPMHIPYVDGILEANQGIQDEVFMTILVWCIDVADYPKALLMAQFALRHKMIMPDRFARTTAVLVTEEIANSYLKTLKTEAPVDISVLEQLEALINLEDADGKVADMPDQVRAKLYVALGKSKIKLINAETELDLSLAQAAKFYLNRAIELDDKCGGKQDLNIVTKLLAKMASQETNHVEDNTPT